MTHTEKSKGPKRTYKKTHSFKTAMILSILLAGLGQIYNKQYIKGISFIILEIAFIVSFADFINLGLWGITTLGTIAGVDDSIFLLVYGILSIILIAFVILFYVLNVLDAKKQATLMSQGWEATTMMEGFKASYDKAFP